MTPARDFRIRLSTGTWDIIVSPLHGVTAYDKVIVIEPSRESRERLDTFVHETIHAAARSMPEAEVARIAKDIAAVLWKAGYRRNP
jgi:hypothetical protein